MSAITYLRAGRMMRATGTVLEVNQARRMTKVKPTRDGWGIVWLTVAEIEAGKEKPPIRPREKKDKPQDAPKRQRKPKPAPIPRWMELVKNVRTLEIDHTPQGWPAVKMHTLSELADELEAAHAKLSEYLPIQTT